VLISIPNDTSLENVRQIITQQNPQLSLKDLIMEPKFCYTSKKGTRNPIIEVESGTRNKLLHTKVTIGWTICKIDDYIVGKRRFRCSRYNHKHRECRGDETCPLCARNHRLSIYKSSTLEYKCMKSLVYNKHHPANQLDIAHSSFDKKCPNLIAVQEKYKKNTGY